METYLKDTYAAINAHAKPTIQDELNGPTTYCKAIWSVDGWIDYKLRELYSFLEPLKSEGVFFEINGAQANLHWTLFQIQTFPIAPVLDTNSLACEASSIQRIIAEHPHLRLKFVGISKSRFGIFLNGYPSFDVNKLRQKFRSTLHGIIEPHQQDICHTTLFRFTHPPSESALLLIDAAVEKFSTTHLCDMEPGNWEYGYGTWLQKIRNVYESWPTIPRWILHRGLLNGPDPMLENQELILKHRLDEGWEVEMDIWNIDDVLWLGHDCPTTILKDESLIMRPGAWVHLKNLDALRKMPQGAHFFIHDTDPATLTSQGFVWFYPGNIVSESIYNSVIVLPERVGFGFPLLGKVKAVCSDYTPCHFIE